MKLSFFAALAASLVVAGHRAEAQGQDHFVVGFSGGVLIPSGIGADNHKVGPNGSVMLGVGGIDSPFGLRFDASYGALGSKTGTGTLGLGAARVTNFNGNVLFTLLGQSRKLYFVGGAGSYSYNPEARGIKTTTDLAVNAGLGLWLPAVNGFVEARWFNLFRALPDPVTGLRGKASLRLYPISFGLMF